MGGNYGNRNQRGRGQNRQNFRGKRNFHHSGGKGRNDDSNNRWQSNDRLSEPEAGITQFISDAKGFHAIIKSRYSDFHVNEVDLEGNEAVLSNFALPEEPEVLVENGDELLKSFISEEQLKSIEDLVGENPNKLEFVSIDVTDYDKDKRAQLHSALKSVFKKKIFNMTVTEEEKKFIQVKKANKSDQQRSQGWRWPHEYTYFIMHKFNIDTLQAISSLAQELRMKPSNFTYAGTKDKRAKTSQWISVKKIEPLKICQTAKRCKGVRVGDFKFVQEPLRLGDLSGNRFRIALRSVKGDTEEIEKSLSSLRDFGFINYYGLQRFGNCQKIPTYMIGKALLAADFKQACALILEERNGEPPFMSTMRKCYKETNDPDQALSCIHSKNTCIEARLLRGLVKHGADNYLNALLTLPRNMLLLYTHAYQSFIFNQIVSKRRELGLDVIEGDLVYTEPCTQVEALIDEAMDDEENDEQEIKEVESVFIQMVRPLTAEDIEKKAFTIFDIVLPLPGFDIKYPSNEIGATYHELMEKDNLSSEKLNSKHKMFSLTGAYRRPFIKPSNFSWKFMKYEEHTDDLILSDLSKLFKDPEPEDKPSAANTALILDFVLPPSAYATMALREILKSDTSVANQMNLEDEVKKEAEAAVAEKRSIENDNDDVEAKKIKIE